MTPWEVLPLPLGMIRHVMLRQGSKCRFTTVRSPESLDRIVNAYPEWNIYWQLNPSKPSARGKLRPSAADVAALQCIVLDIDPLIPNAKLSHAVCDTLMLVDPQKPAVIDTGRGAQLWLIGPPRMLVDNSLRWRVRSYVRRIAKQYGGRHGCIIDTACSDLPRLGRVPGSWNQKTGRRVQLIDRGKPAPWDWLYDQPYEIPTMRHSTTTSALPRGTPLRKYMHRLTDTAIDFILQGCETGFRHRTVYATFASMRDAGVHPDDALSLIQLINERRLEEPLDLPDLERIHRQLYQEQSA